MKFKRAQQFAMNHIIIHPIYDQLHCYMTCSGRNDGVGAQIHGVLSTMLFCKDMGIHYVHSPFIEIAHKPETENHWVKDWETFFNIGQGEIKIEDLSNRDLDIVVIEDREKLPKGKKPNTLFVVPHCHHYTDTVPDNYLRLKETFLEKYNSTAKEKYASYNDPHKINIAVHIRRGDVSLEKYPHRYTPNEVIKQLLSDVETMLSDLDMDISINIFSQGDIEDFKILWGGNVHFYLNECLFTTFCNMVSADILITGKSSFSYTAGLFSNGIIIYDPFWHQPQKDWFTINPLIPFDKKDFKNKVINQLRQTVRL